MSPRIFEQKENAVIALERVVILSLWRTIKVDPWTIVAKKFPCVTDNLRRAVMLRQHAEGVMLWVSEPFQVCQEVGLASMLGRALFGLFVDQVLEVG